MPYVLVLYYSRYGSVAELAQEFATGITLVSGMEAKIRTVPSVSPDYDENSDELPESGPLYCSADDLRNCAGLAMGSPGRFGNMAAPLKYFLEQTTTLWISGELIGKPATLFTSTSTPHGGQESTLLSMMLPLMHHGMLIQPVPFSETALHNNTQGGTPYGVSHVAGTDHQQLNAQTRSLAQNQGKRLAELSMRLLNE